MRRRAPLPALFAALALLGAAALLAVVLGDDDGQSGGAAAAGCTPAEAPPPRDPEPRAAPQALLDATQEYRLVFATSCGSFTVSLDLESAPRAAASLVALARSGWYDGTVFHRIVPGFVIQGGDPTATGGGGPGYSTVDPPPAGTTYPRGAVAMAKTADEAAGTAGSQFFVVTGDDVDLPPEYALVGRVVEGLGVVELIGQLGDAAQLPTQTVLVDSVTVETEPA